MRGRLALLLGLLMPLAAGAQPSTPAAGGAVGYPNNPQATPQAGKGGAPVPTDTSACPANAPCPASPAPSSSADTGSAGSPANGGVRAPTTAYPDSPVKTPATAPSGKAPAN